MGVEYRHFLVADDPRWLPAPDTASRVEKVLREWSLVEVLERVIDLTDGRNCEIPGATTSGHPGHGRAFLFAGIQGEPVARIAGPSWHDGMDDADRYTTQIAVIIGSDYRIHSSSESLCFNLVSPPFQDGKPVRHNRLGDPLGISYYFDQSFLGNDKTGPPTVDVQISEHAEENVAWSDYSGFWRGALVIDFGKDLPAFVRQVHSLPNKDFLVAVEEAFGSDVKEIGEIY